MLSTAYWRLKNSKLNCTKCWLNRLLIVCAPRPHNQTALLSSLFSSNLTEQHMIHIIRYHGFISLTHPVLFSCLCMCLSLSCRREVSSSSPQQLQTSLSLLSLLNKRWTEDLLNLTHLCNTRSSLHCSLVKESTTLPHHTWAEKCVCVRIRMTVC